MVGMLIVVMEIVAVLTALGWFGLIYAGTVTAAHVALYAVVRFRLPLDATMPGLGRAWSKPRVWLLLLAGAAVLAVVAAYASGPYSVEPDTMRYHMVNAVHWLQTHGVTSLPFSEPGDPSAEQPGNGELIGLWLMLPTHDDTIAYLGNVAMAILSLVAIGVGAKRIGVDPRVAALAAAAVLLAPIIVLSQLHSLSTDIVGSAMLMCALALGLAFRGRRPSSARTALLGAALGIAMGTKYVDVMPAVAVGVAIWFMLRRSWTKSDVAVLIATTVAFCATWYVRDWVLAGNPVYPLHIALGAFSVFPKVPVNLYGGLVRPLALHILGGHWAQAASWLRVAVYVVGPALLVPIVAVIARRPPERDRVVGILRWLTVALILIYTVTPFTGAGPDADTYQLAGAMRFMLPALLAGALLFVAVLPVRVTMPLSLMVLAYDLAATITATPRPDLALTPPRLAGGATVAALGLAAVAILTLPAVRNRPRSFATALGGLALVGTAASTVSLSALRPADRPTLIDRARASIGRPDAAVVVMNVFDARQLLGPRLDVVLTAVGVGPAGRQMPIENAAAFSRAVEAEAPVVVAVSDDITPDPRPPGWAPPSYWHRVGDQLDAQVYVVDPPP